MKQDITKLDDDYFSQAIEQELENAESWMATELAREQALNLDFYYGEPLGNETEGFSKVISRDVLETVEGIMPELMKIFTAGDQVVEFDAVAPGDEEKVEIQGRYINHVFMNRAGGYKIMYDWFKDALLMKNGILKVAWEQGEEVQFRTFEDLTEEEFNLIKDGESEDESILGTEYEIDSHSREKEDDKWVYTVRVKMERMRGKPMVEVIPSEDFRIRQRSTSIQDADFVAHVTEHTMGELMAMGYDEDQVDTAISQYYMNTQVKNARWQDPVEPENINENSTYDRTVQYAECWLRSYDPVDSEVKLYKCVHIGNTTVEWEETDVIPLISLAPIMIPHKWTGVAIADLVRDIQVIRSTIYRQMLDNLALQNAGRYTAVEGQVNLQDLIDNRIGGIVRQKMPNAVQRLDTPDLSQYTIPMLEQLDIQKENRTGVSRMNQGLDPNALKSHQAGGTVNQVMTAAQGKILLIARNFAETGVKDLFLAIYNLIREHQTKPDLIPINGRFAMVNPVEWIERTDVHVTVGIGTGNKDQQLLHLQNIGQMLNGISQGSFGYLVTAENTFNFASETIKNSGYYNPNKFISNPQVVEAPPPAPDPLLISAEASMLTAKTDQQFKQTSGAKNMAEAGKTQVEGQLEPAKFDWQKKIDAAEVGLESEQDRGVGIGDGKKG